MPRESWRPTDVEGYEVSNQGRVRSLTRIDGQGRLFPGRILKLTKTRGGYLCVHIGRRSRRVNRLVAFAFAKDYFKGAESAHKDGCRTNNVSSNLCWKTRKENEADKQSHGTLLVGDKCPWAKLTSAGVSEMRVRYDSGECVRDIATRFNTSYGTAYAAVKRLRWRHL